MSSIISLIISTTFLVLKGIITASGSVRDSVGSACGVEAGLGTLRIKSIMIRLILPFLALLPIESLAIYKPEYVVLEKVGDLEIRQYPILIVARTRVEADFEDAGNLAFRRLAGYIFGGNSGQQKISMTAPMTIAPESHGEGAYWISFFMPVEYELADLPEPTDGMVEITRLPALKMAVVAYQGNWSEENYNAHKERLMTLLAGSRWTVSGESVWARYNSPLRPSFMRSNEVMVPVE